MREVVYPHANTIVCIEDSKMLKRFQYEILYSADGLAATLDELNNINYFHSYKNASPENYETMLDSLIGATFALLKDIAPNGLIWRMFTLYYDIHNMKLVVKERFLEKRLDDLALDFGGYSMITIRSAAVRRSDNILGNESLTDGFFGALRSKDIYDVDFILDKTYFQTLSEYAESLGNVEITGFITDKINLFNFSALFQAIAAGSPRGYFEKAFSGHGSLPLKDWLEFSANGYPEKPGDFFLWNRYDSIWRSAETRKQLFSEFDVLCDNYLVEKTKGCKLMAFGIEPICAYFFNKLMEIKNIRVILNGKENGFDTGEIRKRTRIPYEL